MPGFSHGSARLRLDDGDVALLETATRLSRSVARRLVLGVATTPALGLMVVMDGSVALARSSRGRRLLLSLGRGDESLLGRRWGPGPRVAITDGYAEIIGERGVVVFCRSWWGVTCA